jgi:aspartate-semialdehyde dehydrogenase
MVQPKSNRGIRLGIVNPTTLVGNEIKSILRERSFPFAKVALFDATGETAGALTEVGDEPAVVEKTSETSFEDLDLVFFCGPPEPNREWIARHEEDRFIAVDLSQPSTVADEGKPVVAGINLESVTGDEGIIISPHPVAIPIALVMHQVRKAVAVDFCAATVVQPASEFDQVGVEELARQTITVLNVESVPKEVFDRQLAFNLYPAVERNEEFIVRQIKELTSPRLDVALLITQGTTFHGHTFSVFVRASEPVDAATIMNAMKQNPALALPEGDQQFGTIDAAGKDEVLIAEVRVDPSIRGGCWIWAVCDNLRRSSALNAVLVAEKILFGSTVTN